MTGHNDHPGITFRITGYRVKAAPEERLSNGRGGHWQTDHHLFPDGSPQLEDVKRSFPVGSVHPHVPPPPCRYAVIGPDIRTMAEERAQLACRHCYPIGAEPVDQRRTS